MYIRLRLSSIEAVIDTTTNFTITEHKSGNDLRGKFCGVIQLIRIHQLPDDEREGSWVPVTFLFVRFALFVSARNMSITFIN